MCVYVCMDTTCVSRYVSVSVCVCTGVWLQSVCLFTRVRVCVSLYTCVCKCVYAPLLPSPVLHVFTSMCVCVDTRWRRLTGCLKLQVFSRKRANNYRALLRKMP